jgi:hypothetical protein
MEGKNAAMWAACEVRATVRLDGELPRVRGDHGRLLEGTRTGAVGLA